MRDHDLPLLIDWSHDPDAYGEYLSAEHLERESTLEKLNNGFYWAQKNKMFMIEIRDLGPIGTIHYWLRPEREGCAVAKVRIAVPEKRKNGFGTEAQKYLIINLFDREKVEEVEMYTDINNKAQQRCLTKLGFELVDSLTYADHQVSRMGHLYRLKQERYENYPLYQYHYE